MKQTDDRRGTDLLSTGNKQDGSWNDAEVQQRQSGYHEHLPVLSQGLWDFCMTLLRLSGSSIEIKCLNYVLSWSLKLKNSAFNCFI